jgi:hypothetical protein
MSKYNLGKKHNTPKKKSTDYTCLHTHTATLPLESFHNPCPTIAVCSVLAALFVCVSVVDMTFFSLCCAC